MAIQKGFVTDCQGGAVVTNMMISILYTSEFISSFIRPALFIAKQSGHVLLM